MSAGFVEIGRNPALATEAGVDSTGKDILKTAIVDGTGTQITSFGGGTQYTEDAAAPANPTGTSPVLVRDDARAGSLTTTDGDWVSQRGNNFGDAYVIDTAGNVLKGAVNETAPATDTASSGLNGRLQRIAQRLTTMIAALILPSSLGQKTMANSLAVAIASDQSVIKVGVNEVRTTVNFTRPNDTTTYASGDVVADSTSAPTVISLASLVSTNGGSGAILDAMIIDSANQTTKAVLELWVFRNTLGLDNDNAAFTPTDAELQGDLVGVLEFPFVKVGDATSGAGGNCIYQTGLVNLPFICDSDDTGLYAELVVRNAYVPVAQERFDIILRSRRDAT